MATWQNGISNSNFFLAISIFLRQKQWHSIRISMENHCCKAPTLTLTRQETKCHSPELSNFLFHVLLCSTLSFEVGGPGRPLFYLYFSSSFKMTGTFFFAMTFTENAQWRVSLVKFLLSLDQHLWISRKKGTMNSCVHFVLNPKRSLHNLILMSFYFYL